MFDRMQTLSQEALENIHNASMDILQNTGICFNSKKAAALFKQNEFKTDGNLVFFTEEKVRMAVENAPNAFTIRARDPQKTVHVGQDSFIALPTAGATNVTTLSGEHRLGTLADFQNCCKLVQTSQQLDMAGYLMVQPNDIPSETAHLDMVAQYIQMCDKPIFGASNSGEAASDSIHLAGMAFGGKEDDIKSQPIVAAVVNAMSPLQFSEEQTDVIMEMAHWRQPLIITTMILAGSTGPVSLPGLLAQQNAEILAGVVLAQLVSSGTPVVYGSTSAPMDMKTTVSAVGAPETLKIACATTQLARYYDLPCRAGGNLTDSHYPDAQALAEGTLLLSTVVRSGVNFIFHSCGQLGSYISMSFEKWLIDEEILCNIRQMILPTEITPETIDVDLIKSVGVGGQYLTHPKTFTQFKNLSQPISFNRASYEKWCKAGKKPVENVVHEALKARLDSYQKPQLDQGIEQQINDYVARRKSAESNII